MIKIENARNIGPITAAELKIVGLDSLQKLREVGAEEAFLLVIEKFPERLNLNFLYALFGSCRELDWRDISIEDRNALEQFLAKTKKQLKKDVL
ncbi:MAG: TfoX/Sxy family DNA transformation protein [Bdellovibrionota bacterium]|nr:hypothetical protein [Pseudobdellovibrionaceae bacterium]